MNNLEDTVREVVQKFVKDNLLFTGLDVSNEVKKVISNATHKSVSELVRNLYATEMEPCFYGKTPITVSLKDGSVRTALLYHNIFESDLDNKYDLQKRSQIATKPIIQVDVTNNGQHIAITNNNGSHISIDPTGITISGSVSISAPNLWDSMFSSKPPLFPGK